MATELTVRLYFDAEPASRSVFAQLVDAITAWGEANAPWQGLRVSGPQRQVIHRDDAPLEPSALTAAAACFGDGAHQISSRISYRCWRFHGRTAEPGSSLAWVEAWGDRYGEARGEDVRRIWGSAAFTIADVGPYCAVLEASDAEVAAVNQRVEDNLERLTKLIFGFVGTLRPASLKVFTDQGLYLPFNAHLAYYASEARLLDDVRLVAEVWRRGLRDHQVPPLAEVSDGKSIAFHWWRSDEARHRLATKLGGRIERAAAATTDDVGRILASGRFDTYTAPIGFVVLDYPHFMNAFLDRLFVELLDERTG
jgi:hypothetical protein